MQPLVARLTPGCPVRQKQPRAKRQEQNLSYEPGEHFKDLGIIKTANEVNPHQGISALPSLLSSQLKLEFFPPCPKYKVTCLLC